MFLSNWLVFKIVLAAVTGLVDYPLAADVLLVYDNANKLYLSGGSLEYVSNVVLYKGETSYEIEGPNFIAGDEQKILASDAASSDQFGYSISIDGDYAIIGSVNNNAAYIVKRDTTTGVWTEQTKLTPTSDSQNSTSDKFGYYVSISGNYAIVGAPEYNHNQTTNAGAAYIFVRSGTTWTQQDKLIASDLGSYDFFGRSVSISGDYAIIGAPLWDAGTSDTIEGVAYIFVRSGTSWSEQKKLTASDAGQNDNFGASVSISGDYAIVGAWPEDDGGTDAGAVYIFKREGTTWSQQAKLLASDSANLDNFGWSVDIDGDYMIVGAINGDSTVTDSGTAYIFKRDGTTWSEQQKLTASDAAASDKFGWSVSISGNYAIVGAHNNDDNNSSSSGSAYIFKRSGTSWSEQQKLLASDAAQDDEFGASVAISGDYVIIGAYSKNSSTGAAYIYPLKEVTNYYITQPGTYRAELQICGIDYKTNEVEVTGTPTSSKVTQISTGDDASGVLTQDGFVYMWGLDNNGTLGQGTDGVPKNTPVKVKGVGGTGYLGNIIKITRASYATLALASDGTLYAWGNNDYGIIGNGTSGQGNHPLTPVEVSYSGDPISKISGGRLHAGLVTTTGKVYCWGQGTNGQIGDNQSASNRTVPTQVVGVDNIGDLTGIRDITCGDSFTHAIKDSDGSVYAWGKNTYGMLGDGTTTDRNTPVPVILASDNSTVTGITQISSGGDFALFLKSDGTVYSCGYGALGQIGNGSTSNADSGLVQVLGVGGSGYLTGITQIATCDSTSLALKSDGTMYVWGNNADGQNGLGTVGGTNPTTPVAITALTGVNTIAGEGRPNHFIASKLDGSVFCWGRGNSGQIGDGTNTADQGTPTQVLAGAGPSVDGKFNLLTEPRLTFDNYNKLSLLHDISSVSSKLAYGSNVYDVGTLTDKLFIDKTGEYASLTFDTSSNVAYFSNATVNTIATNPLENYRSVTKLDAGVQHSSFQAGTICFWAKALDSGPNYFDGFNTDRGFLQLTTQETYTDHASYGVINLANSTKIRCFSGTTNNSVYTEFANPPYNDGYDPAKWNFYIVYTDSNSGTSYMYLPEFGWSASSSTYGRDHTWLRFDIDDNYVALTDVSVYTGNTGNTESWRTTLYNNGQIGGAANETTNRVHYFRFHKDNLRYNEGTAATDISSSAEMSTSLSLPTFDGVPQLTHDTYNKLSVQNITPTATTLRLDSNTYDIGTATDIYIEDTGTYEAAITASDKFALVSNVVTGLNDPVYITPKLDGGAIYVNGALDDNGSLYLWGLGDNGQLGQGDTNNSTSPVQVKGVGGAGFLENIVDFKCGTGDAFVVACDSSGNCYAWGNNSDGYLGQGDLNGSYTPLQVKGVGGTGFLENIINVCAGHKTAYACDSSGNAYAWGDNYYNSSNTQGMLGDGTIVDKTTPVQVVGVGGSGYLTDIIQVSAAGGGRSGYALSSSGSVYAWGGNTNGQLGNGTYTGSLTPVQVVGVGGTGYLSGIIKLAESTYSYSYQKIALGSDGRVYAWGGGGFGELGQGNTSNSNTPVIVKGVGGTGYLENIIDIAEGGYHCFALDSSGTVYAWGRNASEAPIGDGTSTQRETPVKVLGVGGTGYLSNIVAIGGERFGGSAMDADGNVYAWGGNQNYQVGDGTNTSRTSPVQVLGVGGTGFLDLKTKVPPPSLNFDTYNKLSIQNITPTATTLTYDSNTYDLTTQTDIYIDKAGTYEIETKDANTFALVSNVVDTVTQVAVYDYTLATEQKLLAIDGIGDDNFGNSVAIDGDYAIVGALNDDDKGTSSGAAYILKRSGTSWVEHQKLVPINGAGSDNFGKSVSISGDYAIIGAPGDDGSTTDSGTAYIFKRDETTGIWSEDDKLYSSVGAANDYFGNSVSISGDTAIIGAYSDNNEKGDNAGAAYIYVLSGTTWTLQQKIIATDVVGGDSFGESVSISGDYVIVGSRDDTGYTDSGAAYIFKREVTTWSEIQKIQANDRATSAYFGYAVSISGEYAIVGAFNDVTSGSAYIFKRNTGTEIWTQHQKIIPSDGTSIFYFGYTVSISGDYVIVGAWGSFTERGEAYIFKRNVTTGVWSQQDNIIASDAGSNRAFGYSVAIDGGTAIVGGYADDNVKGTNAGAAYIYTAPNSVPKLDFDGYNKLTLSGLESGSTSTLKYGSNTYDIGTATDIYIEDAGTYEIETKDANTFALVSNTALNVTEYSSTGLDTVIFSKISGSSWTANSLITDIQVKDADDNLLTIEYFYFPNSNGGNDQNLEYINSSSGTLFSNVTDGSYSSVDPSNGEYAYRNTPQTDRILAFLSSTFNGYADGTEIMHVKVVSGEIAKVRVVWDRQLYKQPMRISNNGKTYDITVGSNSNQGLDETYTLGGTYNATSFISFDTYNKLSIQNITPTSTTLKYGSNTYDIGTITDIYIDKAGTYGIETKDTNTFALVSNTVSGTIKTVEPVITGAYSFGHALTYDGKLYGWGENSNGELGVGDTTDKTVPTLCTGIPQGEVVSIWNQSKRGQSRWAKTRDGRIWVTGDHGNYCLPGSSADFTTFTDVSAQFGDYTQTSNNVVWASGSERATQVLMENGDVWSFGNDTGSPGVLGQGASPTSDRTPRKLNVSNITKITYGGDLILALDSSNNIWLWGRNQVGSGGTNGWGPYNVPTNIMSTGTNSLTSLLATDSETVVDIESSYYSMFVLTDKGTVYCTGTNPSGELGQGDTTTKTSSDGWVKIEYFTSNAITVNKLYVGGGENAHIFANTSDGWYCWGENSIGQLGLGDTNDKLSPVKFTGVSNIKKFDGVSYAITEDGKYYAWGRGTNYARGDNTTGNISYPKYIDTLPNILAPSFEFDGYDKVFVNKPAAGKRYTYTFEVAVASNDTTILCEVSASGYTIKESDITVLVGTNQGTEKWVNGIVLNDACYVASQTTVATVGTKLFTIETDVDVTSFTIGTQKPKYMPGWKIYKDGVAVLTETSNRGTGTTPEPVSYSYSLGGTGTLNTELSIVNTKYTKDTHTYDANQAQIVTVSDPGTYDAQLKKSGAFALKSTTIPATKTSGLYTWAFHHGNFDNAYGDGDILTARDNGRFYADTPSYTGDIGTITAGSSTTSNTTYTFTPASALTANVLMVAGGGGGGGRYHAGGGGAGGLVYTAGTTLSGTKTIVVGNGDSGGKADGPNDTNGFNGKNTTFTGLTTAIGGGGGGKNYTAGNDGGSGGGGGASQVSGTPNAGGSGTAGQGNAGGVGIYASDTNRSGGGGGGAGGVGIPGVSSSVSGEGGIGKFFGTGSSFTNFGDEYGEGGYFAGGGGGGVYHTGIPGGIPGRGGGGYGANEYGYMGIGGSQHALPHTGGGGGGSGMGETTDQHPGYDTTGDGGVLGHGGRGGSGIVLIQTNVALPNGANTAVVQVGNPRRRSLPPAVSYMGSEVNRFYIIDGASMPTYKLPTHWYVDPVGSNSNAVFTTQGSHSLQKRADGGTSNVWYATSGVQMSEYGSYMAQTADAVFMPVEQQSYDLLLSIGSNGDNDISFEMNADGTASLRRSVYTTSQVEIAGGSIVCFEAGKWHHIALTVDSGGNAVGYVNGYPVVSGTYTSVAAVGSRGGNMHFRCGISDVTFRKFLTYEVSTYNFLMSPKQVLQRAAEVGLGPKLEYDGLNAINVVNAEPGSGTEITIYESNVNDTSNLYVVACNTSSYLLSNAGTYYAQIKGTDTFTITRPLTVTDDHFPLYQYPPVVTGTKSSLTVSTTADVWNIWTMSGASTGNGEYKAKTSEATNAPGGTPATIAGLFTNGIKNDTITEGGTTHWNMLQTSSATTCDLTLQLPSAKIIRKYVLYPTDSNAPTSPYEPGSSVDPTLPGNSGENSLRRPKSWIFKGSNDGTNWTDLDTVTNQPPSIYGDVHSISSPASYKYYMISVTANNGSTERLQLGEWQLWGDA